MENTQDWNDFGNREIEMAKELLSYIKEIDAGSNPKVEFNQSSGNVFIVDEDCRVFMMNGDKIEEFFSCSYCGHEGFKEDFKHEAQDEDCKEQMKQILGDVK